jgi:AbrB family looped-hinge helix DNA binding protein
MVVVDAQGRMTLPESVRRELGIEGESTLAVAVEDGRMVVRPEPAIPPEDAWAYTPEFIERSKKARAQSAAGEVLQLTESELRKLAGLPPKRTRRTKGRTPVA